VKRKSFRLVAESPSRTGVIRLAACTPAAVEGGYRADKIDEIGRRCWLCYRLAWI